jgi:dihydrodiol dehydrogenase / D-xylose 1-dehydrogenase (NADP)
MGFYFEANAVAGDVVGRRNENSVVPLQESVRMMKVMDEIRKQGGVVYPQDYYHYV